MSHLQLNKFVQLFVMISILMTPTIRATELAPELISDFYKTIQEGNIDYLQEMIALCPSLVYAHPSNDLALLRFVRLNAPYEKSAQIIQTISDKRFELQLQKKLYSCLYFFKITSLRMSQEIPAHC